MSSSKSHEIASRARYAELLSDTGAQIHRFDD